MSEKELSTLLTAEFLTSITPRNESAESIVHRRRSRKGDSPWLRNPWQTSTEVEISGISDPTERTNALSKI